MWRVPTPLTDAQQYHLGDKVDWIPVIYIDGQRAALCLRRLLNDAHRIREVEGEPAQWAALMRFLPSVTALVAQQDPGADFDSWAVEGFPVSAINAALDLISDRLWLQHPTTPFMQEPLVHAGTLYPTEWLHLAAPGPSSKAWWGKPGDHVRPGAHTPARVALGLVTSWYFNPGVGGKALGRYTDDLDTGWRPRGTLGVHNHGIRVFHRGPNLASTLLANTMDSHVTGRGKNMPLWAMDDGALPSAGALTASTWTGSVYRIAWDGDAPVGVHVAGRRHTGYSPEKKARDGRTLAIEKELWRSDPTIPRQPVLKAGEETGEVRPVRALHPTANAVQWAAEWYVVNAQSSRGAAKALEPGLIETTATDMFTIRLDGPTTAYEISHVGRINENTSIATASARTRLLSLASQTLLPIQTTLYVALTKALGEELAKPLHDRMFAAFCADAEEVLDDIIHATELTREHVAEFVNAASTAFERFVGPYVTSRTLAGRDGVPGIAAATVFLESRLAKTLRVHGRIDAT